MNIFKKLMGLSLVTTFFSLYSCVKDKDINYQNNLTNQIDKVVTLYLDGDIKIENTASADYKKVETEASDELKEKIRLELNKSNSKQETFLKSGSNPVGFIRAGSCGTYPELNIFMDSEDSNCQTSHNGNIGDCIASYNTDNGNITLRFCVVDALYFERTNFDYAVLDLGGNIPYGVNGITRVFDNEDSGNRNIVKLNGTLISGYYGGCRFYYDTQLAFYYYVADPSKGSSLPLFSGISQYLVLGISPSGWPQNSIYSDDEDGNNGNSLSTVINVSVNPPSVMSI